MTTIITTPTLAKRQVMRTRRAHPLLTVMAWEARRLRSSRLSWGVALGALSLFLFIKETD